MKHQQWIIRALLLGLALLIAGCEGGGSDGGGRVRLLVGAEGDVLSFASLAGEYDLIEFTLFRPGDIITEEDNRIESFSGTLILTPTGQFVQRVSVTIESSTGRDIREGRYTVIDPTTLEFVIPALFCSLQVTANLFDEVLHTFLSAQQAGLCGEAIGENLVWDRG